SAYPRRENRLTASIRHDTETARGERFGSRCRPDRNSVHKKSRKSIGPRDHRTQTLSHFLRPITSETGDTKRVTKITLAPEPPPPPPFCTSCAQNQRILQKIE